MESDNKRTIEIAGCFHMITIDLSDIVLILTSLLYYIGKLPVVTDQ